MKRLLFLIFILFLGSISFSQQTPAEYVKNFSEMAVKNMKLSGVPASITLAQGILESSSGNSRLAKEANNHFGIKCHNWTGAEIYADDDKKNECFRKYKSAYESYRDHAEFLSTRDRYSFLFELKTSDYKGWAKGLSKAGYATDPKYADKLIGIIERYELYIYDTDRLPDRHEEDKTDQAHGFISESKFIIGTDIYQEFSNNNVPFVLTRNGDDIDKLANDLNLRKWQIKKYNNLDDNETFSEGDIIYLKPKRRKADSKYETHTVQEGESMRDISQQYAVKLNRLYRMNKMDKGTEPSTGTVLNLRSVKR
jgi:hypothetical protein